MTRVPKDAGGSAIGVTALGATGATFAAPHAERNKIVRSRARVCMARCYRVRPHLQACRAVPNLSVAVVA
jgi:hypothetical protein